MTGIVRGLLTAAHEQLQHDFQGRAQGRHENGFASFFSPFDTSCRVPTHRASSSSSSTGPFPNDGLERNTGRRKTSFICENTELAEGRALKVILQSVAEMKDKTPSQLMRTQINPEYGTTRVTGNHSPVWRMIQSLDFLHSQHFQKTEPMFRQTGDGEGLGGNWRFPDEYNEAGNEYPEGAGGTAEAQGTLDCEAFYGSGFLKKPGANYRKKFARPAVKAVKRQLSQVEKAIAWNMEAQRKIDFMFERVLDLRQIALVSLDSVFPARGGRKMWGGFADADNADLTGGAVDDVFQKFLKMYKENLMMDADNGGMNVRMNRKFVCGKKAGDSCAENVTDLKDRLLESCGVRSPECIGCDINFLRASQVMMYHMNFSMVRIKRIASVMRYLTSEGKLGNQGWVPDEKSNDDGKPDPLADGGVMKGLAKMLKSPEDRYCLDESQYVNFLTHIKQFGPFLHRLSALNRLLFHDLVVYRNGMSDILSDVSPFPNTTLLKKQFCSAEVQERVEAEESGDTEFLEAAAAAKRNGTSPKAELNAASGIGKASPTTASSAYKERTARTDKQLKDEVRAEKQKVARLRMAANKAGMMSSQNAVLQATKIGNKFRGGSRLARKGWSRAAGASASAKVGRRQLQKGVMKAPLVLNQNMSKGLAGAAHVLQGNRGHPNPKLLEYSMPGHGQGSIKNIWVVEPNLADPNNSAVSQFGKDVKGVLRRPMKDYNAANYRCAVYSPTKGKQDEVAIASDNWKPLAPFIDLDPMDKKIADYNNPGSTFILKCKDYPKFFYMADKESWGGRMTTSTAEASGEVKVKGCSGSCKGDGPLPKGKTEPRIANPESCAGACSIKGPKTCKETGDCEATSRIFAGVKSKGPSSEGFAPIAEIASCEMKIDTKTPMQTPLAKAYLGLEEIPARPTCACKLVSTGALDPRNVDPNVKNWGNRPGEAYNDKAKKMDVVADSDEGIAIPALFYNISTFSTKELAFYCPGRDHKDQKMHYMRYDKGDNNWYDWDPNDKVITRQLKAEEKIPANLEYDGDGVFFDAKGRPTCKAAGKGKKEAVAEVIESSAMFPLINDAESASLHKMWHKDSTVRNMDLAGKVDQFSDMVEKILHNWKVSLCGEEPYIFNKKERVSMKLNVPSTLTKVGTSHGCFSPGDKDAKKAAGDIGGGWFFCPNGTGYKPNPNKAESALKTIRHALDFYKDDPLGGKTRYVTNNTDYALKDGNADTKSCLSIRAPKAASESHGMFPTGQFKWVNSVSTSSKTNTLALWTQVWGEHVDSANLKKGKILHVGSAGDLTSLPPEVIKRCEEEFSAARKADGKVEEAPEKKQ